MNKKTFIPLIMLIALNFNIMAQNKITQTAGRTALGEFAPKFAELNDDVLFGEAVWNDTTLSLHDHSMITISILLGKGMIDSSFRSHLELGKKHGITRNEIAALLTQAAFYAGWPNAWAGFRIAKEVWADNDAATEKRALPAGDDLPHRRAEHGIRKIFHRQQLPRSCLFPADTLCQRDLRARLPQQLAHPQS